MKSIKINGKDKFFHGNCKDNRIINSKRLLETQDVVEKVILRQYLVGKKHIKRYVNSIKFFDKKVKVSR